MDFSAKATTKGVACVRRRRSCTPPRFSSTLPAIRRWWIWTPWRSGPTWPSPIEGAATGRRLPRPKRRCMAIAVGFGAPETAPDASTWGDGRTLVRARLRHGRDAPHAFARPPEYSQADLDSRQWLQSRPHHAADDRCGHAARSAGPHGDRPGHAIRAPWRSPTPTRLDLHLASVC